mmetsp:Transcript_40226/g.121765  ORF Transcript_40226/g.121765 Transcript_40226/m.121765 type:complete len:245 (-) Transcript_40226:127-861(-)
MHAQVRAAQALEGRLLPSWDNSDLVQGAPHRALHRGLAARGGLEGAPDESEFEGYAAFGGRKWAHTELLCHVQAGCQRGAPQQLHGQQQAVRLNTFNDDRALKLAAHLCQHGLVDRVDLEVHRHDGANAKQQAPVTCGPAACHSHNLQARAWEVGVRDLRYGEPTARPRVQPDLQHRYHGCQAWPALVLLLCACRSPHDGLLPPTGWPPARWCKGVERQEQRDTAVARHVAPVACWRRGHHLAQ